MDDPLLVSRFERVGDLAGDLESLLRFQSAADELLRERLPFHELEHERPHASGLLDAVDRRDVSMVERREDLRFALETRHALGVCGESFRQDLDCHVAPQPRVPGAVHLPHSAGADRRHDFIGPEPGTRSESHRCAEILCAMSRLPRRGSRAWPKTDIAGG